MTIGERIKSIRKKLKLTQQQFADIIGIKRNTVGLIEIGRNNISNQTILSICRVFHICEDWLRFGKGDMFEPQDDLSLLFDDPTLDDVDKVILKSYIALPPELRKVLKEYAKQLSLLVTEKQLGEVTLKNPDIDLNRPEGLSDSEWKMIVQKRTAEVGQKKVAS